MLRPVWYVALPLTAFEIFAVKIWDFGDTWGYRPEKGEKNCPGHSFTILQNFTLIGSTVAEISVPGQIRYTKLPQAWYRTKCYTTVYRIIKDADKFWEFRRNCAAIRPSEANLWENSKFRRFGAVIDRYIDRCKCKKTAVYTQVNGEWHI